MGKLDNRVAIVTGAAQGIGKAVADKLADEGATVVGADIQDGTDDAGRRLEGGRRRADGRRHRRASTASSTCS